jgi:hypothetical protein
LTSIRSLGMSLLCRQGVRSRSGVHQVEQNPRVASVEGADAVILVQ